MQSAPQELLKQYVQNQHFTNMSDIMTAMKEMFRDVIQQVMEVEMEEELGRERCQRASVETNSPNCRNGYSRKTVKTQLGEININVPRDRKAITSRKSFESMTATPKVWRTRSCPCTPAG